jgi:lipopolysaccharide export system ATP-binding protein
MQPSVLRVDSVQLEFDLRKILQDVYLDCKQGEITGLLGRNGSGKSSLLKIIFGTLTPSYKYVSINNVFIQKGYHQNRIAYLPQHNYLPKLRIDVLAKTMVAKASWEKFAALPIYLEHRHKLSTELSGGELRQLEMLMIMHSPADFILMDEPFTHISPVQTDAFKDLLRETAKTKGIIITDHQYYNIIDVSDRLILLNNGNTKHITSPDELVTYGYLSGIH